ncbi:MAG: hypothetical protein Q8P59_08775 [Dehalococcoidia bacterium]|nr:hypothetical protein [Dehalococcoidia bacterium]
MGIRRSGALITLTAVGGGIGAVLTNAGIGYNLPAGKRSRIKKIMAFVTAGAGNGLLLIGFGDNNVASLFRQALPSLFLVAGQTMIWTEDEIPQAGNTIRGFQADTTLLTGTNGDIMVEATNAAIAVGSPVQVILEVEDE